MELCAVVMAAGEGKRMRSNHSKVVQLAAGKPLIRWVAEALSGVGATEQVYIVGHRQEEVREVLGEYVAFVDADDLCEPGMAEAIPLLEKHAPDILVGGFRKGKHTVCSRYRISLRLKQHGPGIRSSSITRRYDEAPLRSFRMDASHISGMRNSHFRMRQ